MPSETAGTSTADGLLRHPEVDRSKLEGGPWDGRALSYIPRRPLPIDPSLELHTEFAADIDVVTYQVLRSRFWNVNLDHSDTIRRVSGSPLIVYQDDLNTSLLTEDGDTFMSGPSVQYFTGYGDLVVKWTLEHRSASPGIEPGDMFLQNDPYIGTCQQMDAMVYAPVFWEGKLFGWIYNSCHVGDIGGELPGSFCPSAPDIFHEPTPVPPIKLVRGGALQADVHDVFVRMSRTPDLVALQLRSQIAGANLAVARLHELLEQFGATTVKGAMRRIIRDCSRAISERLQRLPDGTWREAVYISSAGPDDRALHRLAGTLSKHGDRITYTNRGTDAQYFAANCTYAAWRSVFLAGVCTFLAPDQLYCPAAALDHVQFEPVPGTLNVASFPAAVTPLVGTILSMYLGSQTLSKMLMCGPEDLKQYANATGGVAAPGWWVASGIDRNGRFVADLTGDPLNGAIGAFPLRDGVDTGGAWWWPHSTAGNAEEWEQSLPFIYLYRGERPNSGGPGRWRGGNGLAACALAHKTERLDVAIIATDPAINGSKGLAGGFPGHPGNGLAQWGTPIRSLFAAGKMPRDYDELVGLLGDFARQSPKAEFTLGADDLLVFDYVAGGGFGDPLKRDPALVAADVADGTVTADVAAAVYGVVLSHAGKADVEATERERGQGRRERLKAAEPPRKPGFGRAAQKSVVFEGLATAIDASGATFWACADCGHALAPVEDNYKLGASVLERNPATVAGLRYPDPSDFCSDAFVLRQYLCPDCGELFSTELCRPSDEPLWDIALTAPSAGDSR